MFSYKQRYRPRTNREYTKSDLTVHDSAGNTALNTLKVYGKSEIIDGAIKSAGEGYAVVDLGTLQWNYSTEYTSFTARITDMAIGTYSIAGNILCANYQTKSQAVLNTESTGIAVSNNANVVIIKDPAYIDTTAFKTAMQGVLLCYELADPTQGNCIAVKTDNGTGINGTMATFTTGTPLYSVSADIRDVMVWEGSSGEVTKNCTGIGLSAVGWTKNTVTIQGVEYVYWSHNFPGIRKPAQSSETPTWILSDKYEPIRSTAIAGSQSKITVQPNGTVLVSTEAPTDDTITPSGNFVYQLATHTTEQLTQTENESVANLRTFDGTTHFTNNATTDMTVNYTIKVPTIN